MHVDDFDDMNEMLRHAHGALGEIAYLPAPELSIIQAAATLRAVSSMEETARDAAVTMRAVSSMQGTARDAAVTMRAVSSMQGTARDAAVTMRAVSSMLAAATVVAGQIAKADAGLAHADKEWVEQVERDRRLVQEYQESVDEWPSLVEEALQDFTPTLDAFAEWISDHPEVDRNDPDFWATTLSVDDQTRVRIAWFVRIVVWLWIMSVTAKHYDVEDTISVVTGIGPAALADLAGRITDKFLNRLAGPDN